MRISTLMANPLLAFMLPSHRSPVDELTAGSKAAVVAVIDVLAVTDVAGLLPVGPTRNGVIVQSPLAIEDADRLAVAVVPVLEIKSGSPKS